MRKIRIMIVEDDDDFLFLIRQTLKNEPDFDISAMCNSKKEAISTACASSPDIVLMDLKLESTWVDGVKIARNIRLETNARIIILTAFNQPEIILEACRQTFASAYILKNQFSLLVPTVRATFSGVTPQSILIYNLIIEVLSPAEKIVLEQMMGKNVSLHSKSKTISNQQSSILRKLDLANKSELYHVFSVYNVNTDL